MPVSLCSTLKSARKHVDQLALTEFVFFHWNLSRFVHSPLFWTHAAAARSSLQSCIDAVVDRILLWG